MLRADGNYIIKYLCIYLTNRKLICSNIHAVFRQSATPMVKDTLYLIKISG